MRIVENITDFIFIEDMLCKSDIIFIPGGSHPQPAESAAELFKQGYAPLVMPSGGVSIKTGKFAGVKIRSDLYNKDYQTEWEFLADVLMKNGVPERAILREDTSGHTRGNAFLSRKVADENDLRVARAILCCKSFHARRSLMFYQMAFPDVEFVVVPTDVDGISKKDWYKNEYAVERVMGELSRCGNQFVDDIKGLGWLV